MHKVTYEWLLSLNEKNYWESIGDLPGVDIVVVCSDGEHTTTKRLLQTCHPTLRWSKVYNLPVTMDMLPKKDDVPTQSLFDDLMSINLKASYEQVYTKVPLIKMAELGVDVARILANGSRNVEHYAVAIDANDYRELMYSPEVMDIRKTLLANVKATKNPRDIGNHVTMAYSDMSSYVHNKGVGNHRDNGLVQMMISESARKIQFNQGLVAVGYASEVNSDFFPVPIMANYAEGLNSVYSFATNASSGAKSLMYSHAPMQDTEYLHRFVQQVSSCFNTVEFGDCGSKITYPLSVTKANSKFTVGKYHLVDGVLHEVTASNHKDLIGTTIHCRTVTGCMLPDKGAVCTACGGAVTLAIREWVSVGWTFTTRAYSGVSQSVLAVKHSDMTSVGEAVRLALGVDKHLLPTDDTSGLRFTEPGYQLGFKLKDTLVRLDEVLTMPDSEFDSIDPWDYVNVFDVTIRHADGVTIDYEGSLLERREEFTLSKELMQWLRNNPKAVSYDVSSRKVMSTWVDLSDYPKENKVFVNKFAHYDMLKLFSSIESFIKGRTNSRIKTGEYITDFNSFGEALKSFWGIYSHKLPINLCVLELSLYPFTVTDPDNDDWSPFRGEGYCHFAPMVDLFDNRSLSTKLGSEKIQGVLASAKASTSTNRLASHYDDFFVPRT